MSIHSIDAASAQPLSRERMKAIKGGGGNCYLYCSNADGSNITMSIVTACKYARNVPCRLCCDIFACRLVPDVIMSR